MHEHLDAASRRRVTQARVARFATVRPDGTPHIVPVTFAVDGDTIVTAVDHKPKTTTALQRLRNIGENPGVSIIVDHYDDDWSRLWWVRADGAALVVVDGEVHDRAVAQLADKYEPYRGRPPRGPAIVVTVHRWSSWSAQ